MLGTAAPILMGATGDRYSHGGASRGWRPHDACLVNRWRAVTRPARPRDTPRHRIGRSRGRRRWPSVSTCAGRESIRSEHTDERQRGTSRSNRARRSRRPSQSPRGHSSVLRRGGDLSRRRTFGSHVRVTLPSRGISCVPKHFGRRYRSASKSSSNVLCSPMRRCWDRVDGARSSDAATSSPVVARGHSK